MITQAHGMAAQPEVNLSRAETKEMGTEDKKNKPKSDKSDIDDFVCELDEYPPTLKGKFVDAVCVNVQKTSYAPWGTKKLVFEFKVFEPDEYAGLTLPMYVRLGDWKGRPPVSSKLAKVAELAGCQRRFIKSAFLNKAFRCRLKETRGDAPYSVIAMITEKLTGR